MLFPEGGTRQVLWAIWQRGRRADMAVSGCPDRGVRCTFPHAPLRGEKNPVFLMYLRKAQISLRQTLGDIQRMSRDLCESGTGNQMTVRCLHERHLHGQMKYKHETFCTPAPNQRTLSGILEAPGTKDTILGTG